MTNTPDYEQFGRHFLDRQPLSPNCRQILVDGLAAAEAGADIERMTRRDQGHDWIRILGRDVGSLYDPSGDSVVSLMRLMGFELVERVEKNHYRLTEKGKAVARMILRSPAA